MNHIDGITILAAYLTGAIPFGLLISKAKGMDIRQHGSGNIGATNVLRVLGKPLGITTFFLDAFKGFAPAFFFPSLATQLNFAPANPGLLSVLCGAAAIVGHNFPVFLGFKGGKGVATSAGVLIGIAPMAALVGLGAWGLLFFAFRYVSLASILAALIVGISGWFLYKGNTLLCSVLSVFAAMIILRHRTNMMRLLNGTESRFSKKPKT